MNILFVGDVVGRPGRRALSKAMPVLRQDYAIDFVVVNVENAAGGFGITADIAHEFNDLDVDVMTTGNHVWDKREALEFIEREPRLLRPANYPAGTPGHGQVTVTAANGHRIGVINVMGAVFMHPQLDCPFNCVDEQLTQMDDDVKIRIVDFHAEATSEKVAMGWHLDGRASAVLGTHTHIPTADERILNHGTAYQTDAGMTGCYDSVIGMDTGRTLRRFVRKLPERLETAGGKGTVCGAVIRVDESTGRASAIERIRFNE